MPGGVTYGEGGSVGESAWRDCGKSCCPLTAFSPLLSQNLKSVGTNLWTMMASHSGLGRNLKHFFGPIKKRFVKFSGEGLSHA